MALPLATHNSANSNDDRTDDPFIPVRFIPILEGNQGGGTESYNINKTDSPRLIVGIADLFLDFFHGFFIRMTGVITVFA
jgi:hypothetical protein